MKTETIQKIYMFGIMIGVTLIMAGSVHYFAKEPSLSGLELEVTKDKIVYDEEKDGVIYYKYISDTVAEEANYVFSNNNDFTSGRIIKKGIKTTIIYTGEKVYKDDAGKIYEIKDATTTPEVFNKKPNLLEAFYNFFVPQNLYARTIYTSTDEWTVPAGVTSVDIKVWGGGGGGGVNSFGEGGGGGGAYSITAEISVTPEATYDVIVGTGGGAGVNGGDSYFDAGDDVLAKGGTAGSGGTGSAGGQSGSCVGDTSYSGGTGANFYSTVHGGGGGGGAGDAAVGGNASGGTGGIGGSNSGGDGGTGGVYSGAVATNGEVRGGGGGGGAYGLNAASGGRGEMRIIWDCDPSVEFCVEIFDITGYDSWIAPDNIETAWVSCWGGGGGGFDGSSSGGGVGGGGAAYASSTVSVSAGTNYTIFIGAGGTENTNGATSTFATTTVIAVGGHGGAGPVSGGGEGGLGSDSTGDITSDGGDGGDGGAVGDAGGGGGGAGGPDGAGVNGDDASLGVGGDGGAGDNGSGGAGGAGATTGDGSNGSASILGGGGGGGGANTSGGGNGATRGAGGGGGEECDNGTQCQGAAGACEIRYTESGAEPPAAEPTRPASIIIFD